MLWLFYHRLSLCLLGSITCPYQWCFSVITNNKVVHTVAEPLLFPRNAGQTLTCCTQPKEVLVRRQKQRCGQKTDMIKITIYCNSFVNIFGKQICVCVNFSFYRLSGFIPLLVVTYLWADGHFPNSFSFLRSNNGSPGKTY